MVTNPRSTVSERTNLTLVRGERRKTVKTPRTLTGRIISTAVALVVLAVVLRYLPPGSRNAHAQNVHAPIEEAPDELQLGSVQMSVAPAGEALYLDGLVTNTGYGAVTAATVEVNFHDSHGKVVSSEQKLIMGMSHGGTDLIRNEFARNPIQPNEMRFFRVAIDQVPPAWNHEVPELKIVALKAQ